MFFLLILAQDILIPPINTGCACLGDTLIFRCVVTGAGSTVWEGAAFQCLGNSITLRHNRFSSSEGVSGECGNIVARSIDVNNNCYTSQLSVVISENLNNKSVLCTYDFGTGMKIIGTSTLIVVEGKYWYNNISILCHKFDIKLQNSLRKKSIVIIA